MRFTLGRRTLIVAAVALVAVVGGGIAWASIPYGGAITGCYTKNGGALRVIDAQTTNCTTREQRLDWNVQGAPGAQGSQGPQGAQGPQGPQGTAGAPGISGRQVVTAKFTVPKGSNSYVVNAICPAGKHPLGGGYDVDFAGANEVLWTRPGPFTDGTDGWSINLGQDEDVDTDITVFAVCVSIG